MAPKKTRKEQAAETRQKLIDAGQALLDEGRSVADINIEDITSRCGVSKGTFYVYFPSKDVFFYNQQHPLYADLASALREEHESYVEAVRQGIYDFVKLEDQVDPEFSRIWYNHLYDEDFHVAVGGTSNPGEEYRAAFKDALDRAVEGGELVADAPTELLSEVVMLLCYGNSTREAMGNRQRHLDCEDWPGTVAAIFANDILAPYRPR